MFSTSDVRHYYDAHTSTFVRHGQGGSLGAIHRAVWGPGVVDRAQAFRYVESLILQQVDTIADAHTDLPPSRSASPSLAEPFGGDGARSAPRRRPVHVLDLGCGVGGSLIYLAQARPLRGTGITISPVQATLGRTRATGAGVADRVRIVEGDYTALPGDVAHVDMAYAIESFVHGPSPERFLSEAARVLVPGGVLVICDDVRTDGGEREAAATLAQFARGWHVNTLLTPSELRDKAARAGFVHVETTNLTPYLELARPRDRAIAGLTAALGWIPALKRRWAPLLGGVALQRALARGWIAYHFSVFRRQS